MGYNNKEELDKLIDSLLQREEVSEYMSAIRKADEDLYKHSIEVAQLSIRIAECLSLSEIDIIEIGVGALLHDFGLTIVNIPYMHAEQDDFTPEQMFEYKKHTLYGMEKVESDFRVSNEAKKIMLFHHEKNDKSGYPFQQSPMELNSVGVQIVAITDSYANRLYGVGHVGASKEDSAEYIRKNQSKFFDPRIADMFFQVLEEAK